MDHEVREAHEEETTGSGVTGLSQVIMMMFVVRLGKTFYQIESFSLREFRGLRGKIKFFDCLSQKFLSLIVLSLGPTRIHECCRARIQRLHVR